MSPSTLCVPKCSSNAKKARQAQPGKQFIAVATYLPLKHYSDIIMFLALTYRITKQLKRSEGLVNYALKPSFFRKRFWTYSVWEDPDSVAKFVKAEPHASAVKEFKEWAAEGAAFVEWATTDGAIRWREAFNRLKTPTFTYGKNH